MHLSLLSDSFHADPLRHATPPIGDPALGPTHKAGVVRGLAFMIAVAVPCLLAYASGHREATAATDTQSSITFIAR